MLINAKGTPNSELRIWFSDAHIQQLQIQQIVPEQVATESSSQRATFVFRTGSDGQARVRFDIQPQAVGTITGEIGVAGGDSVRFWSFVFP